VRIAYTVHNVIPHEHEFPVLEARVAQALIDRAHLVHVLTEDAPALVAPTLTLPAERTVHIAHPSYIGVYPEHLSQLQARYELGLTASDTVLAVLGGIRAYKGIGPLLDAFTEAATGDETLQLIVAGKPIDFPEAKGLKARCDAHPRITAMFGRVPEDRLQVYAKAADAIVLSHEGVLNSGVLPLAMGFGRPVIAAARGALPGLVTPDVGVLYDPDAQGALVDALLRARDLKDPAYRQAARKRAEAIAPDLIAETFAGTLRERF
jgi:glycosyltransferase involved in cell wall biosynthesis